MNNTIKTLIATGTIITAGLVGAGGVIDSCEGQRVTYNDKEICLPDKDYIVYSKELMKDYRKGELQLSDLPEFYEMLTIEIKEYKKEKKKDFKLHRATKENLINLTINELKL